MNITQLIELFAPAFRMISSKVSYQFLQIIFRFICRLSYFFGHCYIVDQIIRPIPWWLDFN